jgi:hypothetical protein
VLKRTIQEQWPKYWVVINFHVYIELNTNFLLVFMKNVSYFNFHTMNYLKCFHNVLHQKMYFPYGINPVLLRKLYERAWQQEGCLHFCSSWIVYTSDMRINSHNVWNAGSGMCVGGGGQESEGNWAMIVPYLT